jgi:hypothetical protein
MTIGGAEGASREFPIAPSPEGSGNRASAFAVLIGRMIVFVYGLLARVIAAAFQSFIR